MSNKLPFAVLHNAQSMPLAQIPLRSFADFRRDIVEAVANGQRIAAFFGDVAVSSDNVDLYVVLTNSSDATLRVAKSRLKSSRFESLTLDCPQAHLFEREIADGST